MRIQRRKLIVISIAIICLTVTGIGAYFALQQGINAAFENATSALEALAKLQQDIASRYPAVTEIGLETDNVLVISLVNSPFNDLTETEQQNTAQEIAQFAKEHYTGSSTLRAIQVSFIKHLEILGVSTNRSRTYAFKVMDLK